MMYQQGDVLLKKISNLPIGRKIDRKEKGYILAEGEKTGHSHYIESDVMLIENEGKIFLGTEQEITIKHEEHKHITIPAGNYEIGIVQEYDHFAEEAKNVQD